MPVSRTRSLLFINALLLSTALALPAMAQIEEVVVTAQKKAEDAQNVPIAVTAFTGQDLKTQQIDQFKDLQFHAPNVSYTAGNFGGVDFQIRGIGVTAVGYDSESGVAINFDEVYLSDPQLTEGSFYDLSGVEILAGPQSTLYGRGATGGVVNVNVAKPDLETPMAEVIGDYGNYNATKIQGIVNIPIITDELGLRVAGEWDKHDGYITNINDNSNVDSLDQYSIRPTLRWQPSERTTIDVTGQFSRESDSHMRADKQLCTTDPTGVLGCLPGSAGTEPVNSFSNLSTIFSSQQAITGFLESNLGVPAPTATALGNALGLYNLASAPTLPAGYVDPTGARQVNTDFTPVWRSQDNFLSIKWQQNVTHWLDATGILGYDHDSYFSEESYNNIPGQPLPYSNAGYPGDCGAAEAGFPNLNCAAQTFPTAVATFATEAGLLGGLTAPQAAAFGASYASHYAPYFANVPFAGPGQLPISGVGNNGLTGGNYSFTPNAVAYDQSDGESSQYSGEVRFATSFSGPVNAMLGFYYLHTVTTGDYYVNASTLDYPGIIIGGLAGAFYPQCAATGCIYSPSYYHNIGEQSTLTSKAVFGEVYYQIIPDTLKLTGGLRLTNDDKFNTGRIILYSAFSPIGTTSEAGEGANIPISQQFTAYTGRAVLDWTPKLPFTDSTLVYASYATGYKAGGANPNVEPNTPGIPSEYRPENIRAYEVGTKNILLNSSLQANGDVYYYDYAGLQVSTIQQNTSVNDNIAAHVWGAEGNFLWQPVDRVQLGLNFAHEESDIVHTSLLDPQNPTGNNQNTLLVKDDTISATGGNNCVLYYNGAFPGLPAGYVAPAAGIHALSSAGIPNVAFGSCNFAGGAPAGYSLTGPGGSTTAGQLENLDGHELQNTPTLSVGASAQYTQPLPGEFSLVARVDVHYQTHFWGSIFEDGASKVGSEEVTNASLQLNPPDDVWYVQAYIKNIFDANNITGQYVSSQTSGLYTNAFYGDPRTYGLEVGVKLN